MDNFCCEILQLILYELDDPSSFSRVCRPFYKVTKDPHARAHYFITRYGPDAMYYALGRGPLITERVLEILLSSGARFSRYLCQIACHVYFHTTHHSFLRPPWVRPLPLNVFSKLLSIAAIKYGDIPRNKGEDDGTIFSVFIKESRLSPENKTVTWEQVRVIFEKYDFMPFCIKDPLMSQLPLALAIEPRLLPYARANGFRMDAKYRDFVFRKMFEKPITAHLDHAAEIVGSVCELTRLDTCMFVSRTVAAEICMEASSNEPAYVALKRLDKSGHLQFELSNLVSELLKLFAQSRSISTSNVINVARKLFKDFPSQDPKVRHTMILTAFFNDQGAHEHYINEIRQKIEDMKVTPVTVTDLKYVLLNPFIERHQGVMAYARTQVGRKSSTNSGLSPSQQQELLAEIAVRCLEISSKGRFLKRLCDSNQFLYDHIARAVLKKHHIHPDKFPADAATAQSSSLAHLSHCHFDAPRSIFCEESAVEKVVEDKDAMEVSDDLPSPSNTSANATTSLGHISMETLSSMIRQDELQPTRARRRWFYGQSHRDTTANLPYPHDPWPVAQFIYNHFGADSAVTEVFLSHAIINHNYSVLNTYFPTHSINLMGEARAHVPITLKHFHIMARLEKAPDYHVWHEIHRGAKFYKSEDEYITKKDPAFAVRQKVLAAKRVAVKAESLSPRSMPGSSRQGRRPRRSAASSVSYTVPDSDDEHIMVHEDDMMCIEPSSKKRSRSRCTKAPKGDMQLWIVHLTELEVEEKIKHRERKKQMLKEVGNGEKVTVYRNDFFKSLATHLRDLRCLEDSKALNTSGDQDDGSEEDDSDPDYMSTTTTRAVKRRKIRKSTT